MFHDRRYFEAYKHASHSHETNETLFISENTDGMDLSLYIAESTRQELIDDNPFEHLHSGNLNAFCVSVEGISHFVYLVWNAIHLRSVSQLELELQAEIDKYILCASVLAAQSRGRVPTNLCKLLFDNVTFHQDLNAEQHHRYTRANRYAKKYCTLLHKHLLKVSNGAAITREIRQFYRLWHEYKFKRIKAMTPAH